MPVRVLICVELPLVRDGLRTLLDGEPDLEVVETCATSLQAVMRVRSLRPDVVLVAVAAGDRKGLETLERLGREEFEQPPHLVVFALTDADDVVDRILYVGVHGLLVQQATREELHATIRAAAAGQTMLPPQVTHRLVQWFRAHAPGPGAPLRSALAALTPREREVFELAARGLPTEDIAEELSIGVTTARTHLYRLRCKLQVRDRAELVALAHRSGLLHSA